MKRSNIDIIHSNSSIIDIAIEQVYVELESSGKSDEDIAIQMEALEWIMRPGGVSIMAFLGYSVFGVIIAAITSIFVKREDPTQIV